MNRRAEIAEMEQGDSASLLTLTCARHVGKKNPPPY